MPNAPPVTAGAFMATQAQRMRRRFRILITLIGCYLSFACAAPIITDDAGILLLTSDYWNDIDQYWLYGCTILIAGWVALGSGRFVLRALLGTIASGWLVLAWLLGLTIMPNFRLELELTMLVCAVVAAATLAVLVSLRRCTGTMMILVDAKRENVTKRFQYSLSTLLWVMLLVGVTMALFGWIAPRYRSGAEYWRALVLWNYPFWRKVIAWEVWKVALGPLLIAAGVLPVILSNRKRRFAWAVGFFAAALLVNVLNDRGTWHFIVLPITQGQPVEVYWIRLYLIPHLANLGTIAVCLLTAVTAMHNLGYRLAAAKSGSTGLSSN